MRALAIALALIAAVTTSSSVTAAGKLPTINGELRPAVFGNGDGSIITGGPDGTGINNLGHIRSVTWTSSNAAGWGISWSWAACSNTDWDPRCSRHYRLYVHAGGRVSIRASRPRGGVFTHVVNAGVCWLWRGRGVGYWPANCRTWRIQ